MAVVLVIITTITAVVINGQSAYNESLILTDTAYTIAFSVRQAQSLGLSSRIAGGLSNAGYGVHFAGADSYVMFADTARGLAAPGSAWCPLGAAGTPEAKPGNCRYESGDAIVETYTLGRGFSIGDLCAKNGSAPIDCSITGLDIVFMRPETRAIITDADGDSFTCAEVRLSSPTGAATRTIRVSQLGEISVGQQCL